MRYSSFLMALFLGMTLVVGGYAQQTGTQAKVQNKLDQKGEKAKRQKGEKNQPDNQSKTQDSRLSPGVTVLKDLKGGETHTYWLKLKANDFLNAVVEQKGIDVVVTLFSPDGIQLTQVDSPNGTQGPEPLSFVSEQAGDFRLEIKSLEKDAPPGQYEAKIVELRPATKEDSLRMAAQKALNEGNQLKNQHQKEASLKAIEKFQESLGYWQAISDQQGIAQTLHSLGQLQNDLGEKQKALDSYGQELPLRKAMGDQPGEAATLNDIGMVYDDFGEKQKALDSYNQALILFTRMGDRRNEARILNNIGFVYDDLGEKQKALEYYKKSLQLRRVLGDQRGEATTLNNIGSVYNDLGEKWKALEFYGQALLFSVPWVTSVLKPKFSTTSGWCIPI